MKKEMISIKVSHDNEHIHLYNIDNLVYFFIFIPSNNKSIKVMPVGFPYITSRWCNPVKAKVIDNKVYIDKSELHLMNYNIKFYKTIKRSDYIKGV